MSNKKDVFTVSFTMIMVGDSPIEAAEKCERLLSKNNNIKKIIWEVVNLNTEEEFEIDLHENIVLPEEE